MKADGFTGPFISSLYSDLLVKPMDGSAADTPFVPFTATTRRAEQMKEDLDDVSSPVRAPSSTPR